jgi:PAS domain S-box-containing protein
MEETAELERIILQSVDDAVIATDLQGKIIYWNEGASKMYGWQPTEVLGRDITTVTPSSMSQEQAATIMQSLSKGNESLCNYRVILLIL